MPFRSLVLGALAGLFWITAPASAAEPKDCAPHDDLHFICGLAQPEDLVRVGTTRWVIASGYSNDRGGLFLIDTDAKTAHKLTLGDVIHAHHNPIYPDCNEPPAAAHFGAHGLSLRARAGGQWTLHVVGHGGREAIEIFDVRSARGAAPQLSWIGCVRMPAAAGTFANSVTSLSDGTIYATVLARPGTNFQQIFDGEPTGDVYRWSVGSSGFELVPGLSLSADNGITVSLDETELFVVASGTKDLVAVSRADPSHPLRVAHFPTFTPDNVHYGPDAELIIAGQREDEPSCGGPPKMVNGVPNIASCERGSIVVLVNPKTMAVRMFYDGRPNPGFSGVATGLVIGKQLWLSSFYENRVAYLTLP
jgi:hypothetical protein